MFQKREAANQGKDLMEAAMNKVRDNISVMQTQWRRSNDEVEALKEGGRESLSLDERMAELAKMESMKSQEVADHFNTLSLYEKTFGIAISIVSSKTQPASDTHQSISEYNNRPCGRNKQQLSR